MMSSGKHKPIKQLIAEFFNIDRTITELSGYQVLIELLIILAVLLLVTSPAWLPGLFSWNS